MIEELKPNATTEELNAWAAQKSLGLSVLVEVLCDGDMKQIAGGPRIMNDGAVNFDPFYGH